MAFNAASCGDEQHPSLEADRMRSSFEILLSRRRGACGIREVALAEAGLASRPALPNAYSVEVSLRPQAPLLENDFLRIIVPYDPSASFLLLGKIAGTRMAAEYFTREAISRCVARAHELFGEPLPSAI